MDAKPTPSRSLKRIGLIILLLFIIVLGFFTIRWATYARPPLLEAIEALVNDDLVTVTQTPWLTFSPTQASPQTGLIFYPGGRIDPRGYAPLMEAIAAEGYLVVVPEMPLNMAVFAPNTAEEIVAQFPDIEHWVIGGHSVGGTMAAQFTNTHSELIDGLMIWASYPADNADLSAFDLPVTLIYGNLDPRVNDESVAARQHLLPNHTNYVRIEGGDHHQFGTYAIQPEEHHATISQDAQQEQIIQATLSILDTAGEQ